MITDFWYKPSGFIVYLLLPLSFIFRGIVKIRYLLYRLGLKKVFRFPVPVIVVGNISVGGTGKTPLVIWLAQILTELGLHPAIVSRGIGVKKIEKPRLVERASDVLQVGDEPLLIARRVDCPVVVCADKVAAIDFLLADFYCNVIITDDGLQHYRMGRDVEIAVVDSGRGVGNGHLLPAGPLREPVSRLNTVDFIVYNSASRMKEQGEASTIDGSAGLFNMRLQPGRRLTSVMDFKQQIALEEMDGRVIHAVCGIGHPDRFFNTLRNLGLAIIPHVFPDHHPFKFSDIDFEKESIIIMTEKDAVKCQYFSDARHWFLPVTVALDQQFAHEVMALVCGNDEVV